MIRESWLGRRVAGRCLETCQRCWRLLQQVSTGARAVEDSDQRDSSEQLPDHDLGGRYVPRTDSQTDRLDRRILTDGGRDSGWRFGRLTRLTLAGVGLVLVCLTILVLFRPSLLPLDQLQVSRLTDSIRNNLFRILGVTALVGGVLIYIGRHVVGIGRSSTANRDTNPVPYPPESIRTAPAEQVGQSFDDRLAAIESTRGDDEVDRIQSTLHKRAVELQTLYDEYDEQTATERVETGQWTDDPRAAAFLGGPAVDGPSWRTELWDWLRPMPRAERRIRHTVDALDAYAAEHGQPVTSEGIE